MDMGIGNILNSQQPPCSFFFYTLLLFGLVLNWRPLSQILHQISRDECVQEWAFPNICDPGTSTARNLKFCLKHLVSLTALRKNMFNPPSFVCNHMLLAIVVCRPSEKESDLIFNCNLQGLKHASMENVACIECSLQLWDSDGLVCLIEHWNL